MTVVSRGFGGRRQVDPRVPPGQYRTDDFPVLTAGPTPLIGTSDWTLDVTSLDGTDQSLPWKELMALPVEGIHRRHPLRHQVEQARHTVARGVGRANPGCGGC